MQKPSEMQYNELKLLLCSEEYWNISGFIYTKVDDVPYVFTIVSEILHRRSEVVWSGLTLESFSQEWSIKTGGSVRELLDLLRWTFQSLEEDKEHPLRTTTNTSALDKKFWQLLFQNTTNTSALDKEFWQLLSIVDLHRSSLHMNEDLAKFIDQLTVLTWRGIDRDIYEDTCAMFELCCHFFELTYGILQYPPAIQYISREIIQSEDLNIADWMKKLYMTYKTSQQFRTRIQEFYYVNTPSNTDIWLSSYKNRKKDLHHLLMNAMGGRLHPTICHDVLVSVGHPIVGEIKKVDTFCKNRMKDLKRCSFPRKTCLFCLFLIDFHLQMKLVEEEWFAKNVRVRFRQKKMEWEHIGSMYILEFGPNEWCLAQHATSFTKY